MNIPIVFKKTGNGKFDTQYSKLVIDEIIKAGVAHTVIAQQPSPLNRENEALIIERRKTK